jgi:ABC-2 type transport system ATP-binding protein
MSEASAPAVVVDALVKSYGERRVLDGVSFTVARGEIFGLLGRNGAGKSTTLEILEGLRRPDSGRALVLGVDVASSPRAARERIGVMLQTTALAPRLRVGEALALFAAFHERPRPARELLAEVDLAGRERTPFGALSGGERQRLALALALVHDPDVLLLDEPTAGLDAHSRRQFHDRLVALERRGKSVLLTTHHLDEAERLCDRVAILHHGRILACASPAELVARRERRSNLGSALEDALLEWTSETASEESAS